MRERAGLTKILALLVVMAAWHDLAATCQGRSGYCGWSDHVDVPGGGPAVPTFFDQTSDSAGIWLIFTGTSNAIEIRLTNLTADFDLYIRLPSPPAPTACSCGSESASFYRISDSGGQPGLADECEYLTLADLAPHTCILAIAYCKNPAGGGFDFEVICHTGPGPGAGTCAGGGGAATTCTLSGPAGTTSGDASLIFDAASGVASAVDVTFEFSTDGGLSYAPCAVASGSPLPNPAAGVGLAPATFMWDTLADGIGLSAVTTVETRAVVVDGVSPTPSRCLSAPFAVDNRAPAPSCVLTAPPGTQTGDIALGIDTASASSPTVTIDFLWSSDAGATWLAATPASASPLANPAVGVPLGAATFVWDSRADGVGLAALAAGVLARGRVDDGVSPFSALCTSAAFNVDNRQLCGAICGDCDGSGTLPNILDALTAAQLAAGLLTPTPTQSVCCDVDASLTIAILDALLIAQTSAGLPVTPTCP